MASPRVLGRRLPRVTRAPSRVSVAALLALAALASSSCGGNSASNGAGGASAAGGLAHGGSGGLGNGGVPGASATGGALGASGASTGGTNGRGGGANGGGQGGSVAAGGNGGASGSSGALGGGGASGASGAGGTSSGGAHAYSTIFPLTENPISEGSRWLNGQTDGVDWHDVSTTPGLAIGHQSGTSYTDGTALLEGTWGPNQAAEGVVHTVNQKDSCYQEVELRLRSSLSAKSCAGYEISFRASSTASAYLIIVRWNGPVGDFTYLLNVSGSKYAIKEGDKVKATIVGSTITAYLNGTPVGTASDSTYATGNPGMGFNLETADSTCVGTNGDYGFTSFTASDE